MDRFKERLVQVWNDPVGSKVISVLIIAILGAIWVGLKQLGAWLMSIEWAAWITPLVYTLAEVLTYPVPLWYIGLAGVAWFVFKRVRRRMNALPQTVTKTLRPKTSAGVSEQSIIRDGKVSTKILEQESGTIAVWAKVSDEHNKLGPKRRYAYVIAHAGNNGENLRNPAMARYPNAWAIGRITPYNGRPTGRWRFFCNGVQKEMVEIAWDDACSAGWRLFTVEWSMPSKFIRFYIDASRVGEEPFDHWPKNVTGDFVLGTWAKDAETYRFNSEVGPVITQPSALRPGQLDELLRGKPTT